MNPPERDKPAPLGSPRQALYQKRYCSVLCGDGSVLPIEERLGRRLMRTIDPASAEGRDLLRRGWVSLRTPEGRNIEGRPLPEVYARLRDEVEARLAERPDDESWRLHFDSLRQTIERWQQLLLKPPRDH